MNRQELKAKGQRTMEQFLIIDYHVTEDHLVGYLEAQTGADSKEELEKIKPVLKEIARELLAENPQADQHRKK